MTLAAPSPSARAARRRRTPALPRRTAALRRRVPAQTWRRGSPVGVRAGDVAGAVGAAEPRDLSANPRIDRSAPKRNAAAAPNAQSVCRCVTASAVYLLASCPACGCGGSAAAAETSATTRSVPALRHAYAAAASVRPCRRALIAGWRGWMRRGGAPL
jgi:hypothetical protein